MIPDTYTLPSGKVLVLRVCAPGNLSYGGFRWPALGPVSAPDWDPSPECGRGLHGWLWGEGDFSVCSIAGDGVWMIVEVERGDIVDLAGKVKFPQGIVVASGEREDVVSFLQGIPEARGRKILFATLTGGHDSTLTGGDRSTLTGGHDSTLTGGDGSTLTGGYRSTLTGGDRSTLTGGDQSILTGGYQSTLIFRYLRKPLLCYSVAVAYVGEGGILPGVAYRVDTKTGKIAPARKEAS